MTITSNDPDEPLINVAVLLTVGSPKPTTTPTSIITPTPTSTMTPTPIPTVISIEQDIYLPLIQR